MGVHRDQGGAWEKLSLKPERERPRGQQATGKSSDLLPLSVRSHLHTFLETDKKKGAQLAQSLECAALNLEVMSLSPTWGEEIT